jgi:hypothetical protein
MQLPQQVNAIHEKDDRQLEYESGRPAQPYRDRRQQKLGAGITH